MYYVIISLATGMYFNQFNGGEWARELSWGDWFASFDEASSAAELLLVAGTYNVHTVSF